MEGNGQQHVVVHKRSIDDNLMSATEKMIDSQGAYVTDKLGEDRTENGTKSKRHVKLDGGKIYYGRSEVLINNRIIKVTQQQIGNGQQIIVINKVKRGTKRI
uniref:Uncharacterized protein n=1 Tax=Panagrolaimus superbus TaxID=310955 RepID=A0A914YT06_9BILA